jgi:hypothetical protein
MTSSTDSTDSNDSMIFLTNSVGKVEKNFMSNPGIYVIATYTLEDPALDTALAKFLPKVKITPEDAILEDPAQDALAKLFHIAGFDYYDDGGNFILPGGKASQRVFKLNRPLTRLGVRAISTITNTLKPLGIAVAETATGEIVSQRYDPKRLRPARKSA